MALKVLDLFCGAGGTGMGFHRSGIASHIIGVDNKPQRRYPFEFILADALEFLEQCGDEFDLIVAGPPCQKFSVAQSIQGNDHPDLLTPTRDLLQRLGKPYVIENVSGAPLVNPLMLCGTMFGLKVIRHRLFEIWPDPIWWPPASCNHSGKSDSNRLRDESGRRVIQSFEYVDLLCVVGNDFKVEDARIAMGIDWMTGRELAQAIPPAYTEWIGRQLIGRR
ncbi:MAG: DNA cytosine methyltransferase [Planctomycetota bacterium]|jgi:DNA (cytosine-5)-methyltransferase 1